MRTLWVCNISGGPFQYTATKPGTTALGREEAHRELRISPAEFAEVAAEPGRTLDFVKVASHEKAEVLSAFAAHKAGVTAGHALANQARLKHRRVSGARVSGGDGPFTEGTGSRYPAPVYCRLAVR